MRDGMEKKEAEYQSRKLLLEIDTLFEDFVMADSKLLKEIKAEEIKDRLERLKQQLGTIKGDAGENLEGDYHV